MNAIKELFTGDDHVTNKDVIKAAEKQEDLQYKKVKEDLKQDKKIVEAAEKLEKEAHKQRMKDLEANKDLAKAAEKLQHEQNKKFEKDMEANAKINHAANKVAELQNKQFVQDCHLLSHDACDHQQVLVTKTSKLTAILYVYHQIVLLFQLHTFTKSFAFQVTLVLPDSHQLCGGQMNCLLVILTLGAI
jgi:hypothetical protein